MQDMTGQYNDDGGPLPVEIGMDAKADLMIKLLEKLPQRVTKPIVIQHTQTMDEQFKLTVNEEEKGKQPKMNNKKN